MSQSIKPDGPRKFDVWQVDLNPTRGSEIAKMRPCVVVSPNEMNVAVRTIIVAPLTSTRRNWAFRPKVNFGGVEGDCAIDQLRSVDRTRLVKRLGQLGETDAKRVSNYLIALFQ
jgi:mRNA interferase MazF